MRTNIKVGQLLSNLNDLIETEKSIFLIMKPENEEIFIAFCQYYKRDFDIMKESLGIANNK